jgi:pyrroline-5-carboxylate reductase
MSSVIPVVKILISIAAEIKYKDLHFAAGNCIVRTIPSASLT